VSPFSIDTALAMSYAGARGETARQMAGVLHLPKGDTNVHACFKTLLKAIERDKRHRLSTRNGQFALGATRISVFETVSGTSS
jgi:serpin B